MLATQLIPALAAFHLVHANLDKPIINPAIPALDQGLLDHLKPTHSSHSEWGAGWIPQGCYDKAKDYGFSPSDFIPFNIVYDDCPNLPWVFCRHKDAPISEITIIDTFGRFPVRMRQYQRHMIFVPGNDFGASYGDTLISGQGKITLFAHEIAQSLDSHAFDPSLLPFYNSKPWLDAYNQDSAVSDSTAQSEQLENFAQELVIALFDKVVPGGIGSVEPNWQAIFHAYATIQGYIGDVIIPGGQCDPNVRLQNTPAVPMRPSAKFRRDAKLEY